MKNECDANVLSGDKKYFENFSKKLNPINHLHNFERRWRKIVEYFPDIAAKSDLKILELAAGEGYNAQLIHSKTASDLYAVDYSFSACVQAKKNLNDSAKIYKADVTALPFRDKSFDVVFGNAFLHHIDDQENVIKESVRVTKDQGCIFFFEPNRFNPILFLFALRHYSVEKGVFSLKPKLLAKYFRGTGRTYDVQIKPHTTFLFPYQKFPPQSLVPFFSTLETLLDCPLICTNYAIMARCK